MRGFATFGGMNSYSSAPHLAKLPSLLPSEINVHQDQIALCSALLTNPPAPGIALNQLQHLQGACDPEPDDLGPSSCLLCLDTVIPIQRLHIFCVL